MTVWIFLLQYKTKTGGVNLQSVWLILCFSFILLGFASPPSFASASVLFFTIQLMLCMAAFRLTAEQLYCTICVIQELVHMQTVL